MKYGEKLVEQSVPRWSLHNVDYNSLKHEIKVHTSRDQARAIAIPGHQDTALAKFEDQLYGELLRQHHRVDLFVTTKAGEIIRRLEHLADLIQRLIIRCNHQSVMTVRRQRRLAKYERELLRSGDDIAGLSRFVSAQVVAFRKLLKKYKKWTGSTTLGTRFKEIVLQNPKSFTRRDFEHLQNRHGEILRGLNDASLSGTPNHPRPVSFSTPPAAMPPEPDRKRLLQFQMAERPTRREDDEPDSEERAPIRYWNEYDDGSEGGSVDEYVIYVNPDEDTVGCTMPGFGYLASILGPPLNRAKAWCSARASHVERRPLLPAPATSGSGSGSDSEDVWSSDEAMGWGAGMVTSTGTGMGGGAAAALARGGPYGSVSVAAERRPPSGRQHRRSRKMGWITVGSFAAALSLLAVEAMLLGTGQIEIDAAVAATAVTSLFFSVCGLWAGACLRGEGSPWGHVSPETRLIVWATFGSNLLLNVLVLGIVMGNLGVYITL